MCPNSRTPSIPTADMLVSAGRKPMSLIGSISSCNVLNRVGQPEDEIGEAVLFSKGHKSRKQAAYPSKWN